MKVTVLHVFSIFYCFLFTWYSFVLNVKQTCNKRTSFRFQHCFYCDPHSSTKWTDTLKVYVINILEGRWSELFYMSSWYSIVFFFTWYPVVLNVKCLLKLKSKLATRGLLLYSNIASSVFLNKVNRHT